jgi:hypothetical protein
VAKSEPRTENLTALLEQHWLHCRHLETERAWFLNVYGAVVGAILAFSAQGLGNNAISTDSPLFYALSLFVIGITFFGFFLTLRWTHAFECHRAKVNKITEVLWSTSGVKAPLDPTMNIPAINMMPRCTAKGKKLDGSEKVVNEFFKTRYWFPLFYFLVLMGITLFLFIFIKVPIWMSLISLAALLVAVWLGVGWYFSLKLAK